MCIHNFHQFGTPFNSPLIHTFENVAGDRLHADNSYGILQLWRGESLGRKVCCTIIWDILFMPCRPSTVSLLRYTFLPVTCILPPGECIWASVLKRATIGERRMKRVRGVLTRYNAADFSKGNVQQPDIRIFVFGTKWSSHLIVLGSFNKIFCHLLVTLHARLRMGK